MIESIVVLPALVSLSVIVFLCVAIFWLRISLNHITQEMAACSLSIESSWQCQRKAQVSAKLLFEHWGFQNVQIQTILREDTGTLQSKASWSFLGISRMLHWSFHSKSFVER